MSTRTHSMFRLLAALLVLTLLLSACASAAAPLEMEARSVEGYGGGAPAAAPAAPVMEAPAAESKAYDAATGQSANTAAAQERIVITNGSLTITVPDPGASMERIRALAKEMGGFVVGANLYKEYSNTGIEVPRANITIRVPAGRMDEAMQRIQAESGQEPRNVTITSQDVTSEYVDLQSRLANLEAAEKELTRIMEDANRTEDVLAVYQQLVSIREQIEVIKGQIKYYDEASALSSISVDLVADAAVQPIEIGGWQPQGVAKDALEALVRTMQGLVEVVLWLLIYLLPVLLVLSLIFVLPPFLIIRALVRRSRAKKSAAAANFPPPAAPAE